MKTKANLRTVTVLLVAAAFSMFVMGCDETKSDALKEDIVTETQTKKEKSKQENQVTKADAGASDQKAVPAEPAGQVKVTESVQDGVDSEVGEAVDEKRKDISEEAMTAIRETENALIALDEKKPDEAISALERATGKLTVLLAREPGLALAPTAMHVTTRDVLSTLDEIHELRDKAEDLLEDGEVQKAREILAGLASEIVVAVTNLPLASYPEAVKAAIPLIDKGKIDQAKAALQSALSTLVVTERIIPIPILRAELILRAAEPLAENENRSKDECQELTELLENARYQVELAKALGYGDKDDYKQLFEQIEEIEEKTEGDKAGKGFFNDIKTSLKKFKNSILH